MKTMAEERASEYANVPRVKRVNQIAREMVILITWQVILRKEHVIARINTLALEECSKSLDAHKVVQICSLDLSPAFHLCRK